MSSLQDSLYTIHNINLTGGISDFPVYCQGKKIKYLQGTATIQIKIDDVSRNGIDFIEDSKYMGDFEKIYITGNANETIILCVFASVDSDIEYPSATSGAVASTNCLTNQVVVTDSETVILPATSGGIKESEVTNIGDNDIYISGSGVTSANGHLLPVGVSKSFSSYSGDLYGICATGLTSSVSYFKAV